MGNSSSKVIACIQMHYTDLDFMIDKYNCIEQLKNSQCIDSIVIVCPDMKHNIKLKEFAELNGVDIFFGDIDNVINRIYSAAVEYGAKVIVRPSIRWFMIDVAYIDNLVEQLLVQQADYICLANELDERFAAEIFSFAAIEKMKSLVESEPQKYDIYKFSPAAFAEIEEIGIKRNTADDSLTYDNEKFEELFEKMQYLWVSSGRGNSYADRPVYPYRFAKQFLREQDKVLDIACGTGFGSNILSADSEVFCVGVDIDKELIDSAKQRFVSNGQLEFLCRSFEDLNVADNSYDAIVSIHTMEHIENDTGFLQQLNKWLKPDGLLILEVPIMRKFPFVDSKRPLNPAHLIEYDLEELKEKVSVNFIIENIYGVNHGFYTGVDKMRNACMIIARSK